MKAWFPVLALAAASVATAATEIRRYDTRLTLEPDGSARAEATVELTGATSGRLRIPLGFARPQDFAPLGLPAGAAMTAHSDADSGWVELELPAGVAATLKLGFGFKTGAQLFVPQPEPGQKPTLPAGSQLLRHRFTNTQDVPIGRYALEVLFPDGLIAHAIREQSPRAGRKEVTPRVELDRLDGRQGARLQVSRLRTGDRTTMELELVPQQRSLVWALLLLPLALGYLVAFRDLVRATPGDAPAG